MTPKQWAVSEDGTIEYNSLSSETLEGGLNVMRNSFFQNEPVSIAVEVAKYPDAAKELEELSLNAARDGVSLVAIDKSTGNVIAVAFNKLQVKESPGETSYFETFAKNCKHASSKALVEFMIDVDAHCNVFDYYDVDCLLEVMFLATLPEYRGRGIGTKLFELSLELARTLLEGIMIKETIDERIKLKLEPVPKVASTVASSFITQKITEKLGFEKLATISYEKYTFQGNTFASKIGKSTPNTTLEAIKL